MNFKYIILFIVIHFNYKMGIIYTDSCTDKEILSIFYNVIEDETILKNFECNDISCKFFDDKKFIIFKSVKTDDNEDKIVLKYYHNEKIDVFDSFNSSDNDENKKVCLIKMILFCNIEIRYDLKGVKKIDINSFNDIELNDILLNLINIFKLKYNYKNNTIIGIPPNSFAFSYLFYEDTDNIFILRKNKPPFKLGDKKYHSKKFNFEIYSSELEYIKKNDVIIINFCYDPEINEDIIDFFENQNINVTFFISIIDIKELYLLNPIKKEIHLKLNPKINKSLIYSL